MQMSDAKQRQEDSSEAETDISEHVPTRKVKRLKRRRSNSDSNEFLTDDNKLPSRQNPYKQHVRQKSAGLSHSPASRSNSPGIPGATKKNKRDANGRLILQRMCDKGKYEEAKELILNGADVNDRDYAGNTPLHEAALKGHTHIVDLLLSHGAIIDIRSGPGDLDTPLIDAASNDHLETVKLLIKRGADPRIYNAQGQSPMDTLQSDTPNFKEIERLLKEAALTFKKKRQSSDASDEDFMDPANYPVGTFPPNESNSLQLSSRDPPKRHGARAQPIRNDLLWMDLTTRAGREQVYQKAADGDTEFVGNVLGNGWKPDADCLALAARHGHIDVVGLLLAFGASIINGRTKEGLTPLQAAIGRGHYSTVKLLLESGADPSMKNSDGKNCLQLAKESLGINQKEIALLERYLPSGKGTDIRTERRDNEKSGESKHDRSENERHERKNSDKGDIKHEHRESHENRQDRRDSDKSIDRRHEKRENEKEKRDSEKTLESRHRLTDTKTEKSKGKLVSALFKDEKVTKQSSVKTDVTKVMKPKEPSSKEKSRHEVKESTAKEKPRIDKLDKPSTNKVRKKVLPEGLKRSSKSEENLPGKLKSVSSPTDTEHRKPEKNLDVKKSSPRDSTEDTKPLKEEKPEVVRVKKESQVVADAVAKDEQKRLREKLRIEREKKMLDQLEADELKRKKRHDMEIKQEQERLQQQKAEVKKKDSISIPPAHSGVEFLPLLARKFRAGTYVIDIQVAMLLGVQNIYHVYPDLSKILIHDEQKDKIWNFFVPYFCRPFPRYEDVSNEELLKERETQKKRFVNNSLFWLRVDQVEDLISRDFPHIYEKYKRSGLLFIDLDYEKPTDMKIVDTLNNDGKIQLAKELELINLPLKLKIKLLTKPQAPKMW